MAIKLEKVSNQMRKSIIIALILACFVFGCGKRENQTTNSTKSSNTVTIDGTTLTYEEIKQISDKVMAEKKRRGLSDRDALILMDQEEKKFIAEKRKSQPQENK
jgi:uncharacterized lipoprotein YehR (DUF1307 family)